MDSNQDKSVMQYNSKSEYTNKRTWGQKANGEIQLKECTIRSDSSDGLTELGLDSIEEFYKMCKERNIKVVSPYETGHEPSV
jgi:hypothetical protein